MFAEEENQPTNQPTVTNQPTKSQSPTFFVQELDEEAISELPKMRFYARARLHPFSPISDFSATVSRCYNNAYGDTKILPQKVTITGIGAQVYVYQDGTIHAGVRIPVTLTNNSYAAYNRGD